MAVYYNDGFTIRDEEKRKSGKVKIMVIILSALVALGAGGYIAKIFLFDPWLNSKGTQSLKLEILESAETNPIIQTHGPNSPNATAERPAPSQLASAKEKYPDIVGWIQIEDTAIDYPVAQSSKEDPEYYLRKDLDGNYLTAGTIFLDSAHEFTGDLQILYGHNMTDGTMFKDLTKYETIGGIKKIPVIFYDTIEETRDYVVFGVFKTSVDPDADNYFYYNIEKFESLEEKLRYLYDLESHSLARTNVAVNENDDLLLLSTCEYDFDNCRLVVAARKIREGEELRNYEASAALEPFSESGWKKLYDGKIADSWDIIQKTVTTEEN